MGYGGRVHFTGVTLIGIIHLQFKIQILYSERDANNATARDFSRICKSFLRIIVVF